VEADQAREPEPAVAGSNPEARESNQVFAPDRSGRTVLLAEYPALPLGAAIEVPLDRILCAEKTA